MAKSNETKIAEKMADALNNTQFSTSVLANYLVTHYPTYTIDRLMELVRYIIEYSSVKMRSEWEINERTSEGLLLADALNDMIKAKYGDNN